MVKITNPLGDVKIGRQGEVVYQRKYGEQIRRQVSPKRAIPSQAQIAHRQLYRDALTWRSNLPLANRRYLDGYCIANGIVDGYHIPLPWSRFALKLYLQKVGFVLITKPTLALTEMEGKNQAYDNEADMDGEGSAYQGRWYAQTFTPSEDLELTSVEIYARRIGNPLASYLRIKQTDVNGHPTGADLGVASWGFGYPSNILSWQGRDIAIPCLNKGELYALILECHQGNSTNAIYWGRDASSPTYPYGCLEYSTDGGVIWATYETYDMLFRIYGKWMGYSGEPGLLHVRQPALLKVIQKRDGLLVNGHYTLSSLDEEYLTAQVGMDVEPGDLIKATTLPGIDYDYRVG